MQCRTTLNHCRSTCIDKTTCCSINHFCSEGDLVHRLVLEGFVRGKENVISLPWHPDAPWTDHAAMSPTIKEKLTDTLKEYIKR